MKEATKRMHIDAVITMVIIFFDDVFCVRSGIFISIPSSFYLPLFYVLFYFSEACFF